MYDRRVYTYLAIVIAVSPNNLVKIDVFRNSRGGPAQHAVLGAQLFRPQAQKMLRAFLFGVGVCFFFQHQLFFKYAFGENKFEPPFRIRRRTIFFKALFLFACSRTKLKIERRKSGVCGELLSRWHAATEGMGKRFIKWMTGAVG